MAKRMSRDVAKAAAKYAGRGISDRFLDRAFWLETDPLTELWIEAFESFDATSDKQPLLKLW